MHFKHFHVKLEGCSELNKHNTVFGRSGPLYATGFSLSLPESLDESDISIDRPRYLVSNNRRSAQWRSQILLLFTAITCIYWSSRLYRSDQLQRSAAIFSSTTRRVAVYVETQCNIASKRTFPTGVRQMTQLFTYLLTH